jgi:Ca-activated chloride channel family protein
MRIRLESILPILLYAFVTAPVAQPQQSAPSKPSTPAEGDVIRVETSLVTLPVRVTERGGKVVYALGREQFQVFENGIEQEIAYFESPDASPVEEPNIRPLTIALMLDVSDSTEFKLTSIKNAALIFVDLLRAEDRVIVVVFDKNVQVLVESTSDRYVVRRAINALHTGGGTSLYEALNEVIAKRLARISGRKAIVVLTDGVDTASKSISFDGLIRVAETSDVTIYPVQYQTYADFTDNPSREAQGVGTYGPPAHVTRNGEFASEAYKRATVYLRLLAEKTAGHFQYADSAKKLAKSFDTIARELREHYTVGYYPKDKTDGARKVEIRIRDNPKLTVRTRGSYVYKNSRNR